MTHPLRPLVITAAIALAGMTMSASAQSLDDIKALLAARSLSDTQAPSRDQPDDTQRLETAALLLDFLAERSKPSGNSINTVNAVPDDYDGPVAKIAIGTIITGVLNLTQISDYPGPWRGTLTRPIQSPDGQYIAAPAGTVIVGTGALAEGANKPIHNRMTLKPTALVLPDGTAVPLGGQFVVDQTGVGGIADKVDYHVEIQIGGVIGGAVTRALPDVLLEVIGDDSNNRISDSVINELGDEGTTAFDRYASLVPTVELRAGTPFNLFFMQETLLPAWRTTERFKYFTGGIEGNSQ